MTVHKTIVGKYVIDMRENITIFMLYIRKMKDLEWQGIRA